MIKSLHIFAQTIKRTILLILAIITLATPALAQTSGTCGENLTWTLSDNGTLTISGTGDMENDWWPQPSDLIIKVVITDGVTSIGNWAFDGCTNLTSVTIPNSVTNIGYGAFDGCSSLTSIAIPSSVTMIELHVFSDCTSLTLIDVAAGNSHYSSIDGVLFNADKARLVAYPNGKVATSYTIPNSVTSIDTTAFYGCKYLQSINIPNSVTNIGLGGVFCESLTSINVEDGNRYYVSMDGVLFNADKSTLISYPAGKPSTSYAIPGSVTSIYYGAFINATILTSIAIPNNVTSIGDWAFQDCSSLTSITIPNSVTSIGEGTFIGCFDLTSIDIPNSITSIGEDAFDSSGLTSITIPNSVTEIGSYAFAYCDSLTSVSVKATTPPTIYSSTFTNYAPLLYVPTGSKAAYQAADYWSDFTNIVEKDFTIAIDEVADDSDLSISVEDGHIVVVGTTDYTITNLNGVQVSPSQVLPAGIYIVCAADGKACKVIVP